MEECFKDSSMYNIWVDKTTIVGKFFFFYNLPNKKTLILCSLPTPGVGNNSALLVPACFHWKPKKITKNIMKTIFAVPVNPLMHRAINEPHTIQSAPVYRMFKDFLKPPQHLPIPSPPLQFPPILRSSSRKRVKTSSGCRRAFDLINTIK